MTDKKQNLELMKKEAEQKAIDLVNQLFEKYKNVPNTEDAQKTMMNDVQESLKDFLVGKEKEISDKVLNDEVRKSKDPKEGI